MSKTSKQFLYTPDHVEIIGDVRISKQLDVGAYSLAFDGNRGVLMYVPFQMNYDKIIDLPSKEYDTVISEMNQFLKPETKQSYVDHGFLYKRSIFLHGVPGTGKTCIVNRVCEAVTKTGGIILFNENPQLTAMALQELQKTMPDTLVLVIFEEFDELLQNSRKESELLKMLDGQIQKNNAVYLATTNFLNKIPKRVLRPGRFSRLIEVGFPSLEARTKYISLVSKNPSIVKELAEKTEGFSIDELKECVLSISCLGYTIDETIKRIKDTKEITSQLKNNANEDDVELDFWGEDELEKLNALGGGAKMGSN
jgi:SpoVK/Ycf46/Vps4 family AAA+-type ATPase